MKNIIFLILGVFILSSCGEDALGEAKDRELGTCSISTANTIELYGLDTAGAISTFVEDMATNDVAHIAPNTGECKVSVGVCPVSGSGTVVTGTGVASSNEIVIANDITNLYSIVTISSTCSGTPKVDDYCVVNEPFDSIACDINEDISLTKKELTSYMGSSTTASFSVKVGKDSEEAVKTNEIIINKYMIHQITNIRGSQEANDGINNLTVYNGALYFGGIDLNGHTKLFKYDGTIITQVSNINNGANDTVRGMLVYNSELYFSAKQGSYTKLFKYDGTTITQISNIAGDTHNDYVQNLIVYNDVLYFSAYLNNYTKLFKYDGTTITQVSNIAGDTLSDNPLYLTVYNGALYFRASNASYEANIYKYDDTSDSIVKISESIVPRDLVIYNNELYFQGKVGTSTKLLKYDGTNITQVSDINSGNSDEPEELTVYNGELYFIGDTSYGVKLFKYDGISIKRISNINEEHSDDIENLMVANNKLYFVAGASNFGYGTKLFKYDGTTITQISDLNEDDDSCDYLTVYNNALYFSASNEGGYIKMYMVND